MSHREKNIKYKGFFTTDINDTCWFCRPVYYGDTYFKAKLDFYSKNGGYLICQGKYKIYYDKVEHWYKYDPKS